jgi:hypothetical protein
MQEDTQEALEIELKKAEIPYEREKPLPIIYDGKPLKQAYRLILSVLGKSSKLFVNSSVSVRVRPWLF